MNHSNHNERLLAILSLLAAAAMWGTVWYPLRLLEAAGLAGLWSAAISYSAAIGVGLVLVLRNRRGWRERPWLLLALGLSAGWCNVSFILAVLEGNVVRVLLLFYLSPLWTIVLGWLLLGERMGRTAAMVFVLAMVGAVIMLWDMDLGLPWPRDRADWLAVSSGFAFALTNVWTRQLQSVPVRVKSMANWLGVLLVALVWALLSGVPLPDVTPVVVAWALLLGVFGFLLMTLLVLYGVTRMPVHRSAVLLLFELVAGAVSASLLTDELVMPNEWIGGALVIVAAWYTARTEEAST